MKGKRAIYLTVEEALQRASSCLSEAGLDYPRFEAEMLLAHACTTDRLQLLLDQGKQLSEKTTVVFFQAVARRSRAEPAAYITGAKEFYGLNFMVNPDVLIPRPETEHLVDAVVEWAGEKGYHGGKGILGIDLGTGSGIIAVTLAKMLPETAFIAVDLSASAMAVASLNAARHGVEGNIQMRQGDYFKALDSLKPRPRFNLVVSNPPYIPRVEIANLPDTVREYEPINALDGGPDGLAGYRAILGRLRFYIKKPALVVLEIDSGQERAVTDMFHETGIFHTVVVRPDYRGLSRLVLGLA